MTQLNAKGLPVSPTQPAHRLLSKDQSAQLYQTAKQYTRMGDWVVALAAVEKLINSYPKVQELQDMRRDLLQHIAQNESTAYQKSPLYRAAFRHARQGKWASGLTLVENLLRRYPQSKELTDLREELSKRISVQKTARTRRRLLLMLAMLFTLFGGVSALFLRYVWRPAPLNELIAPIAGLNYPPHYLFSIYGTDKPIGVGLSPLGDRIYVAEMGGSRLVKIFDQKGNPVGSIELPHTQIGERAPVYLATDQAGQVYVSDRKQHAIYIFNRDGEYINTLMGPGQTLSAFMEKQSQGQLMGERFYYNLFQNMLFYLTPDGKEQSVALPFLPEWSPLGIRIDNQDHMYLTDVAKDRNVVLKFILKPESDTSNQLLDPPAAVLGNTGQGEGEFLFPNAAMADSKGRIYVTDGNNGRISVWDNQGKFLFTFGKGVGDGALSLPRGLIVDQRDRLFIVDAVGQNVKVYDISGEKPVFLYTFGDFGAGDGLFNYPNDIVEDGNGRLYIADRENNRIQVWSY